MAKFIAPKRLFSNFIFKNALITQLSVRGMAYMPKHWHSPLTEAKHVDKPLDKGDPRLNETIRPAPSSFTFSESYDPLVDKFMNHMMRGGDKHTMRKIMDKTFEHIKYIQIERYNKASDLERLDIELNPSKVFHQAIENIMPLLGTQRAVKGGTTFTVPVPISEQRRTFLAMKFLRGATFRGDKQVRMWERLARECIAASNNEGAAVRRKQELHRVCEQNRQHARLRW